MYIIILCRCQLKIHTGVGRYNDPRHGRVLEKTMGRLMSKDISVVYKSNIHQKFAIMDQKIVWYGSVNLLNCGNAQESMMRIESSNIANELVKSIERQ
jgi:hypothetical protein